MSTLMLKLTLAVAMPILKFYKADAKAEVEPRTSNPPKGRTNIFLTQ